MLKYAWEDTHYLLFIFDCMKVDLLKAAKDQNPATFLKSVWNRSWQISLGVYEKPKVKDMEYFRIMTWNSTAMDELQLKLLNKLMFWRDYIGWIEDESTKFVMNNDVMFGIAKQVPTSLIKS